MGPNLFLGRREDFDPRFFNAVAEDQIYPGFLTGGEPVKLVNLSPRGKLRFQLPKCELAVAVQIAGEESVVQMNMETLLLEPEKDLFCMAWRGSIACDKKTLKVEKAVFELSGMEGVET